MVTACSAMAALVTAPLAGKLSGSRKVDPRVLISGGLLWIGFTTLLRSHWTTDEGMWSYAFPIFLQGFGMPFFFIPLTTLVLNAVDPHETASGAGLQAFMRTIAVAVSTSLVLTYWGNQQRVMHNEIANILNPDATTDTLDGLGMSAEAIRSYVNGIVDTQAITVAMNHATVMAAISVFLAAGVLWLAPKPVARQGVEGMGH